MNHRNDASRYMKGPGPNVQQVPRTTVIGGTPTYEVRLVDFHHQRSELLNLNYAKWETFYECFMFDNFNLAVNYWGA